MNTAIIAGQNVRTGTLAPAVRELQRSESPRREDRESAASRKGLPPYLIPFDGDEVAISPDRSSTLGGMQEQLPVRVPPSGSPQAVEERKSGSEGALAVKGPGSAVDSGVVRYTVNVGPCDVHVSTMAMRRYGEASSYRTWHASTFEVTV